MKLYLTTYDGHPLEGGQENIAKITGNPNRIPIELEAIGRGIVVTKTAIMLNPVNGEYTDPVTHAGLHMENGELFACCELRTLPGLPGVSRPFSMLCFPAGAITINLGFEDK